MKTKVKRMMATTMKDTYFQLTLRTRTVADRKSSSSSAAAGELFSVTDDDLGEGETRIEMEFVAEASALALVSPDVDEEVEETSFEMS